MSTLLTSSPSIPTLGDLLERLGGVPAERVRYFPLPGTATVADVVEIRDRERRLCELVGGVLVQKPIGFWEIRRPAFPWHGQLASSYVEPTGSSFT